MKIKREDIINAAHYFPIDYDQVVDMMKTSGKKFFAFNGRVFDKEKDVEKLDYKKSICEIEETDGDGFDYE